MKKFSLTLHDLPQDLINLMANDIFGKEEITKFEKRKLFQMFNNDNPIIGYFYYQNNKLSFQVEKSKTPLNLYIDSTPPLSPRSGDSGESAESVETYCESFDSDPDSPKAGRKTTGYYNYLIKYLPGTENFILVSPSKTLEKKSIQIKYGNEILGNWDDVNYFWRITEHAVPLLLSLGAKLHSSVTDIILKTYNLERQIEQIEQFRI